MSIGVMEVLGAARGGRGMRGLGELTKYPAVGRLQRQLNAVKAVYSDWTPGSDIGEDEKYGRTTHRRLKSFLRWAMRTVPVIPDCGSMGTDELDESGPASTMFCLVAALFPAPYRSFSSDEVNDIQQAWREWKDAGSATENERIVPTNPAGSDGTPPAAPEQQASTGMSTGEWLLLGGGVLGMLGLIAWFVWGDKGKR